MTSFIALYRGDTVSGARLVALTADPMMVRDFADRLITDDPDENPRPDLHLVESHKPNEQEERPGGHPAKSANPRPKRFS